MRLQQGCPFLLKILKPGGHVPSGERFVVHFEGVLLPNLKNIVYKGKIFYFNFKKENQIKANCIISFSVFTFTF